MAVRSCLAVLVLSTPALADVVREGTGPRREALNAMELTPFDSGLWSKLTGWTGGPAIDASATGGQVVLICTWSSWYAPSVRQGLTTAQKAADKYGEKGLVVVGVHHQEGWADGAAAAEKAGAKFRQAHDSKNEFRAALKVDQDPDFFLLDRAGHLRYADVDTGSVDRAIAELIAETKEAASDLPKLLKERREKEVASSKQHETIRTDIELSSLPPVPPGYTQPDEQAYKDARWPQLTREEAQQFGLIDFQGNRQEKQLNFSPEAWYPREPAVQGRAFVIYFWHPDLSQSYSILSRMDALQSRNVRDLVVIGALTPRNNIEPNRTGQENNETPEDLEKKLRTFLSARNYTHTLAADFGATALLSIAGQFSGSQLPVPSAMLVSSDGIIRWIGSVNSNRFQSSVDAMLLNDPGVRARREADRKFIESRK